MQLCYLSTLIPGFKDYVSVVSGFCPRNKQPKLVLSACTSTYSLICYKILLPLETRAKGKLTVSPTPGSKFSHAYKSKQYTRSLLLAAYIFLLEVRHPFTSHTRGPCNLIQLHCWACYRTFTPFGYQQVFYFQQFNVIQVVLGPGIQCSEAGPHSEFACQAYKITFSFRDSLPSAEEPALFFLIHLFSFEEQTM